MECWVNTFVWVVDIGSMFERAGVCASYEFRVVMGRVEEERIVLGGALDRFEDLAVGGFRVFSTQSCATHSKGKLTCLTLIEIYGLLSNCKRVANMSLKQ